MTISSNIRHSGFQHSGPLTQVTRWLPKRGHKTISFIGLDGAGKGTYIELLKKECEESRHHVSVIYLGYSNYQLSLLKQVLKKRTFTKNRLLYKAYTALYLLLLPIDFMLRRGLGSVEILITDRHPVYEPVFKSGVIQCYNKVIEALCPRVEKVFYLHGNPEVLWERKKEVSLAEYKSRQKYLEELIAKNKENVIFINTEGQIENVYKQIREATGLFT